MSSASDPARAAILEGATCLGVEFGSTRIKACLVGPDHRPIATGSHAWEGELVAGNWTYSLSEVWSGLQDAVADLFTQVERRYDVRPRGVRALGVSAMMHGYLALDGECVPLVPFRSWRNTTTARAAAELTERLGHNIPLRWSIAHLYQALLDGEPHVSRIESLTTLAGFVHRGLSGEHVLGVGDASGMFPIDPATGGYDARMLEVADGLLADHGWTRHLLEVLPAVLPAGREAGRLTAEGAALLDPSGSLQPGIPLCPPEGDAGTGMVATHSISPRTGNVSVGTSVFAMVVLDEPMTEVHPEIDVVTTPAGAPVAMVHCNNGAHELSEWTSLFHRFAVLAGSDADLDTVFGLLLREALDGEPDAGGVVAYNFLTGEPVAGGLVAGRPIVIRTPDSTLSLANLARALIFGIFGALTLGMQVLWQAGAKLDVLYAHGGLFRTEAVAQRLLAAALETPVAVGRSASEGGAWGVAVLAAFLCSETSDLERFLSDEVFADDASDPVAPDAEDVRGYQEFMKRYTSGIALQQVAVDVV